MDRTSAEALRDLLSATGLGERTRGFGRSLRRTRVGRSPGGLLVVGTPDDEPWHFTAHLRDEAEYADAPELVPTLVRWSPPPGAPAHLAVDLTRVERAQRGESLLVVSPSAAPDDLLNRVDDARHRGAAVFSVSDGDRQLEGISDEALLLAHEPLTSGVDFDAVTHLVSLATGAPLSHRRGLRSRLAMLLDGIVGGSERG